MNDERRSGGNGAVVAIVVVLGIIVLLGGVLVVGAGALFFVRMTPAPMPVAVTSAVAPPVAMTPPAQVINSEDLAPAAKLPLELNAQDEILVNGEVKSLDDLKKILKEMKNGNTNQNEIKIKFSGSSPAKTQEMIALLKEACVFYEIDSTGDVPPEPTMP